eukprot:GHVR01068765.1.p1 GENE.GHVR01068765.1~~GHVR01068765.1.p1  ORF type:complete len:140 (+),score=4.13 GHVR01068765.1:390-809(+)
MNYMPSELSITPLLNGLPSPAQEMPPCQERTILHVRFKRIKCSYLEVATPLMKDTTTPFTLNYVMINFKSAHFQWNQPPNQKSVGPPKNTMSKIGGPEPRAYHSMTYFKNKIIIFGGHGGVDYHRTAFNDIYELYLDSF